MTFKEIQTGSTNFRLKRDSMHRCKKVGPTAAIFISYIGPRDHEKDLSKVGARVDDIKPDEEIVLFGAAA